MLGGVIRVLVVDDHQAIRIGLVALLRQEPGFVPVAAAGTVDDAVELARREAVDVAVVDYHLADASGVEVCRRLPESVKAMLYTAVPLERVLITALVSGALGALSKAAPADHLFQALRDVARGRPFHPPVVREALEAAAQRLGGEDLPIVGMAVDHTPRREMADALRIDQHELERRIDRVLAGLDPRLPANVRAR